MKTVVALCLIMLCVSASVDARMVTARGEVGYGSSDSGIDDANQQCCIFLTKSDVAKAIFASCGMGDECEVVCEVDWNYLIDNVYSVRRIDTNVEPSAKVIRSAACWASNIERSRCSMSELNTSVEVLSLAKEVNESINVWHLEYVLSFRENIKSEMKEIDRRSVIIERVGDGWVYKALN